ncbi:MAG: VOC family protein [Polyangiaceae bacterium]
MTKTQGIHHAGLTVPDVARASRFFVEALGFAEVGAIPDYPAIFVSDGQVMLTLWQGDADALPADRRRQLGLHHLALRVPDRAALESLHRDLAARDDVEVEFAPEPLREGPVHHMMFFIPGHIRLELIAPVAG